MRKKKLRLNIETLRSLTDSEAGRVVGGNTGDTCDTSCGEGNTCIAACGTGGAFTCADSCYASNCNESCASCGSCEYTICAYTCQTFVSWC